MVLNRTIKTIQEFIKLESAGGIILVAVATLALILDNTPFNAYYVLMQNTHLTIAIENYALSKTLLHWVNDGLMAIFFFLVGLEIKREVVEGELNSLHKFALPGFAAVGGMIVPALIYVWLNWHDPASLQGWAIPTATDIAFALGVLSLLGKRVPVSLKIFLTALAILDDLGAILIIALFYTKNLSYISLILAALCILLLIILNRSNIMAKTPYILVGLLLWLFVLQSGVHATLAGVVLAMAIPISDPNNPDRSPLRELEHSLHPWVAFLVLPIFAFFNAGVSFAGLTVNTLTQSLPLGIASGLFFGKQIGIFGACWIAVKTKLAQIPRGANWVNIYGISLVCGIGFTMSLFIGTLAFDETDPHYAVAIRLGVLIGSVLSGLIGYLVLYFSCKKAKVAAINSD